MPGLGSAYIAEYNPDAELEYARMTGVPMPVLIAITHGLAHCWHFLSGAFRLGRGADLDTQIGAGHLQEEAYTVGLGPYAETQPF